MRWSQGDRLPNIKAVIDRYHLYDRTLDRNLQKMRGSGSPCTSWRNTSITPTGTLPVGETKCYCWSLPDGSSNASSTPDKKHFLCMGTGYLKGYQKYGYEEIIISTPSVLNKSNNVITTGDHGGTLAISGTTSSIEEDITTDRFTLTNFQDVSYFFVNDAFEPKENRVEYQYSTDDSSWTSITMLNYSLSPLAAR